MGLHMDEQRRSRLHLLVLAAATLALCQQTPHVDAARQAEEKLIGWQGETYNVEAKWDPLKHEPKDSIPLPGKSARPRPTRPCSAHRCPSSSLNTRHGPAIGTVLRTCSLVVVDRARKLAAAGVHLSQPDNGP
jgi:hypothetical protein